MLFAPPFWAHEQVTPKGPNFGGCNFCTPHFGPFWSHLPTFWFCTLSVSGTPLHQQTPNLRLANPHTARQQPIPKTGGRLHKRHPTYGSRTHPRQASNHAPTMGNRSPTKRWSLTSTATPTPMKIKNEFSFGLPQGRPLLLWHPRTNTLSVLCVTP